jgi:hypothetical protein
MQVALIHESQTEKECPLCGRGLARTHGPEIPCTLCVRLGPPSVRHKEQTSHHQCGGKDRAINILVKDALHLKGGLDEKE